MIARTSSALALACACAPAAAGFGFPAPTELLQDVRVVSVAFGDIDADGRPDVALLGRHSDPTRDYRLEIHFRQADGTSACGSARHRPGKEIATGKS